MRLTQLYFAGALVAATLIIQSGRNDDAEID
jgi:hypothetical protein